jgi:hypothetical protein
MCTCCITATPEGENSAEGCIRAASSVACTEVLALAGHHYIIYGTATDKGCGLLKGSTAAYACISIQDDLSYEASNRFCI